MLQRLFEPRTWADLYEQECCFPLVADVDITHTEKPTLAEGAKSELHLGGVH
jgi:hypothetical protein